MTALCPRKVAQKFARKWERRPWKQRGGNWLAK